MRSTAILALFVAVLGFTKGAIRIIQGPASVEAMVGDTVTFSCEYTGTIDLPNWKIGGTDYSVVDLPPEHRYTNEGLQVRGVQASLNNTEYRCFFVTYSSGQFYRIESAPAYLVIRSIATQPVINPTEVTVQIPTDPPTDEAPTDESPTDEPSEEELTTVIQDKLSSAAVAYSSVAATTTVFFANVTTSSTGVIYVQPSQLPYTSSFVTTTAVNSTVPSDVVIGNTSMPHTYQILYIGVGTGAAFALCLLLTTALVIAFACKKIKLGSKVRTEKQDIELNRNVAYEISKPQYSMKKNEAYQAVSIEA